MGGRRRSRKSMPREAISMRRSVLVLTLGLVGGLGLMGCKSTQQKLQESITQAFQEDPTAGNVLCGYPVPGGGLSNVSVTSVTHSGSDRAGTGTANVTGSPMAVPGMP